MKVRHVLVLAVGFGVGYLVGSASGREQFDRISQIAAQGLSAAVNTEREVA